MGGETDRQTLSQKQQSGFATADEVQLYGQQSVITHTDTQIKVKISTLSVSIQMFVMNRVWNKNQRLLHVSAAEKLPLWHLAIGVFVWVSEWVSAPGPFSPLFVTGGAGAGVLKGEAVVVCCCWHQLFSDQRGGQHSEVFLPPLSFWHARACTPIHTLLTKTMAATESEPHVTTLDSCIFCAPRSG